jgi:hypothetical protein
MAAPLQIRFAIVTSLIALAPALAAWPENELVTRTYKLDIAKIKTLPETILAEQTPPSSSPSDLLRALLSNEGITFPTNPPAAPTLDPNKLGKGFYFNERTGELHLRTTRRDIPKFEKHLAELSPEPPRVQIDTFIVEIPDRFVISQSPTTFTNLASLSNFTNLSILTPSAFRTTLDDIKHFEPALTTTQTSILTISTRPVRILGSDPPFLPPPNIAPTTIEGTGTLIIRADSDL